MSRQRHKVKRPKIFILDGMWNKTLAAVRSLGARGFHVTVGEKTRWLQRFFQGIVQGE